MIKKFPEHALWLYKIPEVVPRTYIAAETAMENEPRKIMERLASANFNPLRQVMLENGPALSRPEGFRAAVAVVHYSDTEVKIRAFLSGAGVLVLTDSFYPGWRVYVNGREREILKANFFFRGVVLPAGTHMVEFLYQPRSFTLGLAASLTILCGVILVFVISDFKSERAY